MRDFNHTCFGVGCDNKQISECELKHLLDTITALKKEVVEYRKALKSMATFEHWEDCEANHETDWKNCICSVGVCINLIEKYGDKKEA